VKPKRWPICAVLAYACALFLIYSIIPAPYPGNGGNWGNYTGVLGAVILVGIGILIYVLGLALNIASLVRGERFRIWSCFSLVIYGGLPIAFYILAFVPRSELPEWSKFF